MLTLRQKISLTINMTCCKWVVAKKMYEYQDKLIYVMAGAKRWKVVIYDNGKIHTLQSKSSETRLFALNLSEAKDVLMERLKRFYKADIKDVKEVPFY